MLDRLVRGSVFAQENAVVAEDEYRVDFHQRRQPDRGTAVVGKNQERGAVGNQTVERHAVQDRAHAVLADAKVKILRAVVALAEVA